MRYAPSSFCRVALVSEHASPLAELGGPDAGGQNVYVAQLAEHLTRRGHEVTVYTRRDSPGLPDQVTTSRGVRVVHVPAGPARPVPKDELFPYMAEFGDFLARQWRTRPPDVAHAHFWMSGTAALAGARALGVPVVQTYHALGTVKKRHQGADDTSPPQRPAMEATIGRECRRVLATCADEVTELTAMGVDRSRISVVPCGVDPTHFAPVAGAAPRPGGPRRLLAVGRLVRRKGFDRAIRALVDVPDAELLIAGGPEAELLFAEPEAERLLKVAEEYRVADRVTLLGAVHHAAMPRLMSSADLVLSLPHYEPFGIVPIEAMACRTPVLATAVGGHLDTVLDGVTGALVAPAAPAEEDGDDLAGVVRALLADPERLARYGAAGRERVLARYTWDRVTDGVCRVYSAVRADAAPSLSGAVR
ncbi:D-inositol-3-phosphate glycosyltransferase [Streptomyces aurantiacus]|uniref:glycosyltransferase n=1 Tax=Streptomyces aurantiacus TaxID=47760 RepID=UPI0027924BAF|nr:glycosyltransferase [Streptomyces aurantiacus]MDQ0773481.1 D-inositol-3-phosphate glycosyltransferase [Streptomyces aurantiacus]